MTSLPLILFSGLLGCHDVPEHDYDEVLDMPSLDTGTIAEDTDDTDECGEEACDGYIHNLPHNPDEYVCVSFEQQTDTSILTQPNLGDPSLLSHVFENVQTKKSAWHDFDEDSDTDLFLVSDNGSSLYENQNGNYTIASPGIENTETGIAAVWLGSDLILATNNGIRFYKKQTGNSFVESANTYGLVDPDYRDITGFALSDYDNDGIEDVFVTTANGYNRLFKQDDQGYFENVEFEAGVSGSPYEASMAATWSQTENHLYVANVNGSNGYFINQGDGTFVESAAELSLSDGGATMAAGWGKIHALMEPGLFLGRWEQSNLLEIPLYDDGGNLKYYEEVSRLTQLDPTFQTEDAAWLDYDHDNDEDLIVMPYLGEAVLFKNNSRTIELCP